MTNKELLEAPESMTHGIDRQRRYVLRMALLPMECPACLKPVSQIDALGGDIESYGFGPGDYAREM